MPIGSASIGQVADSAYSEIFGWVLLHGRPSMKFADVIHGSWRLAQS